MSFHAAYLAVKKYGKKNVLLYFNDTKWEHKDLYRFLEDIKIYLDKDIFFDSDGRSPEQVFFDQHFLGNDRVPLCSRILKAERLQKYYKDGDNLIFGIGIEEKRRVQRIVAAYQTVYAKTSKFCALGFPLVEREISKEETMAWFKRTEIKIPELYTLGFEHNNCSGGCVRQGKRQWKHLLSALPDVYRERELLEKRFREVFGKGSYLKNTTLEELRGDMVLDSEEPFHGECIGICQFVA